jgi:phospholipid/cholesterol/gamma-HCH transport system permease protein
MPAHLVQTPDRAVVIALDGRWQLASSISDTEAILATLARDVPARVGFTSQGLDSWDTSLLLFARRVHAVCQAHGCPVDDSGLPEGVRRMLALAEGSQLPHPPRAGPRLSWLGRLGSWVSDCALGGVTWLAFLGELLFALRKLIAGHARLRRSDVAVELTAASVNAIVIVTVVGILLGTILAFVATVILRRFGATLYVADVVTIGMVRELGPLMTAMVMAGRSGSAYAAEIATMRVTDEVNALVTMGIDPMAFLVLPRLLALIASLPLLTVYVDAIALTSGAFVATRLSGIDRARYLVESQAAIPLSTFWVGAAKSVVFGAVVALCGCADGMNSGRSAAAVGQAATSAVVKAILWIIACDGVFAVVLYWVNL